MAFSSLVSALRLGRLVVLAKVPEVTLTALSPTSLKAEPEIAPAPFRVRVTPGRERPVAPVGVK